MEEITEQLQSTSAAPTQPNSVATYVLAVVCLVVGVGVGYLLHAPKSFAPAAAVAQTQDQAAVAAAMAGGMPTPEQMNHMISKAVEPILRALQKEPGNAELLAQAGAVYFRAQQFPVAAQYFERAVKINPTPKGFVSLSNAYHFSGADDRAIKSLNSALEIDPNMPDALFNRGMLNWKANNDPKAAIQDWQHLLKTNPKHPQRAQVERIIAQAKKHMTMNTASTGSPQM